MYTIFNYTPIFIFNTIHIYSNTGNLALIEASKQHLTYQKSTLYQSIYDFNTVLRDLKQWTNLDDVIMGGKSSSRWDAVDWKGEGSSFARWSGNVITEVSCHNSDSSLPTSCKHLN